MNAGQEVELVQTSPLALYNFLSYDVLGHRVENGEPPDREEHYILLDMGADNTTLLVSNGRSIWIRNVPIGGNHFTRALTKEMKLTFAKAEHLKCNATRSPDPRAVFQALRPVFNDYVSEIQRSIGYFSSVNREAVVSKVLGVGNGFKLAGLQKFLQQNLQYEVERVDSYNGLVGDSVLNSSLFQDNIMSFTVPYGLALQGLGVTRIRTSLLPPEIAMERKIRRKKPWAIAAAAGLLGAFSLSAVGNAMVYKSVSEETFKPGHEAVATLKSAVGKNSSDYETALSKHNEIKDKGLELTGSLDRRELWLEVYKAINEALPRDLDDRQADDPDPSRKNRIRLTSITAEKVDDLADWFKGLKEADVQLSMAVGRPEDAAKAPEGAGYVFTIIGSHFRDDIKDPNNSDRGFVQTQFISNLQKWVLDRGGLEIPVRKAGISHVLLTDIVNRKVLFDPNNPSGGRYAAPAASASANLPGDSRLSAGGGGGGAGLTIGGDDSPPPTGGGAAGGSGLPFGADDFNPDRKPTRELTEYQFKVQFVWKPTKPAERPETEPPTAEVSDSAEKK